MGYVADRLEECRPVKPLKDVVVTPLSMISARFSLATWMCLNPTKKGYELELYALIWLGLLWYLLSVGPVTGTFRVLILGAGIYRLQDLVFASLDNVFGLTKRGEQWKDDLPGAAPVVINLLNVLQVIVIFALFYQNWPGAGPDGFWGDKGHTETLPGNLGFGFLYLSWTTLFPPGSGYTPIHPVTGWLFMAESVCGLLIIGLTLAALLAGVNKPAPGPTAATPPVQRSVIGTWEVRDIAIIIVCAVVTGVVAGFTCGVLVGVLTSG